MRRTLVQADTPAGDRWWASQPASMGNVDGTVTVTELGAYRTGMRRAVAIACLGTIHTDRVDLWIDGLLDDEQEEAG